MKRRRMSRTITFSLPIRMAEQVWQVVREEGSTMSEILREALRPYLADRSLRLQEQEERLRPSQLEPVGAMRTKTVADVTVYGLDFSSAPTRRKPIVCLECRLVDDVLELVRPRPWHLMGTFDAFEAFLEAPPPCGSQQWIAGADFPFGLAMRFIDNMGWPKRWEDYIDAHLAPLCIQGREGRQAWRRLLDDYKRDRQDGDKEHRRRTDEIAGSLSPQKQYGVPVGMMLFEGAPRLRAAGVTIPGLQEGDPERVVVEAYPGAAVDNLMGEKRGYKNDIRNKQTVEHLDARREILQTLLSSSAKTYGIRVQGTERHDVLIADGTGDHLDALLCAVQAAWAWREGGPNFGLPEPICRTEGWIADPIGLPNPNRDFN